MLIAIAVALLAQSGAPRVVLQTGHQGAMTVRGAFTADCKYFLSAGDDEAILWDVATGKQVAQSSSTRARMWNPAAFAIETGTPRVAYMEDGKLILHNLESGDRKVLNDFGSSPLGFMNFPLGYAREKGFAAIADPLVWCTEKGIQASKCVLPHNRYSFTPSGAKAVGVDDGAIQVWDVGDGSSKKIPSPSGKKIWEADYIDERQIALRDDAFDLIILDSQTGQSKSVASEDLGHATSANGKWFAVRCSGKPSTLVELKVFDTRDWKVVASNETNAIPLGISDDGSLVALNTQTVFGGVRPAFYDAKTLTPLNRDVQPLSGLGISPHPTEPVLIVSFFRQLMDLRDHVFWWDLKTGLFPKPLSLGAGSLALSPKATYAVIERADKIAFTSSTDANKVFFEYPIENAGYTTDVRFSPDDKWCAIISGTKGLLLSTDPWKITETFDGSLIRDRARSSAQWSLVSQNAILVWDASLKVELYDARTGKLVATDEASLPKPPGEWESYKDSFQGTREEGNISTRIVFGKKRYAFVFSPSAGMVASGYTVSRSTDRITYEGDLIKTPRIEHLSDQFRWLVRISSMPGGDVKHKFEADLQPRALSPDGSVLACAGGDLVQVLETSSGKKIAEVTLDLPLSIHDQFQFTADNRLLIRNTGATAEIYRVDTQKLAATLFVSVSGEAAIVLPSGLYSGSPAALGLLGIRLGNRSYDPDTFDATLNRPGEVARALGYAGTGALEQLDSLTQARLARIGSVPTVAGLEKLPHVEATLIGPVVREAATADVDCSISRASNDGGSLILSVNGVPSGYLVDGRQVSSAGFNVNGGDWKGRLRVKLSAGLNTIQVRVVDSKGVASAPGQVVCVSLDKGVPRKLFLVALGVSKYQDSSANLRYAASDAERLTEHFKTEKLGFDAVETLLLRDEEVTLECLPRLRAFFGKAGLNDTVILFVAGHGLLDASKYYFASHDIDFAKPGVKGIPFDSLEALLKGLDSRNKLMLMDTCHAGEAPAKPAGFQVPLTVETQGVNVKAVAVRSITAKTPLENRGLLLSDYFADLNRADGIVAIGASSAADVAIEYEAIKGGIFTAAVVVGLMPEQDFSGKTYLRADLNHDGEVRSDELKSYVDGLVIQATNGKQQPTVRTQNYGFGVLVGRYKS